MWSVYILGCCNHWYVIAIWASAYVLRICSIAFCTATKDTISEEEFFVFHFAIIIRHAYAFKSLQTAN